MLEGPRAGALPHQRSYYIYPGTATNNPVVRTLLKAVQSTFFNLEEEERDVLEQFSCMQGQLEQTLVPMATTIVSHAIAMYVCMYLVYYSSM